MGFHCPGGVVVSTAEPTDLASWSSIHAAMTCDTPDGPGRVGTVDVGRLPRESITMRRQTVRVETVSAKNRMHLDIETADIEREAQRLIGLGAQRLDDSTCSEDGSTWILMADPEGNEFCICDNGTA